MRREANRLAAEAYKKKKDERTWRNVDWEARKQECAHRWRNGDDMPSKDDTRDDDDDDDKDMWDLLVAEGKEGPGMASSSAMVGPGQASSSAVTATAPDPQTPACRGTGSGT